MYAHALIGQIVTRTGRAKNGDGSYIGDKLRILSVEYQPAIKIEIIDSPGLVSEWKSSPYESIVDEFWNDNNWEPYPSEKDMKNNYMNKAYKNIERTINDHIDTMREDLAGLHEAIDINSFMRHKQNLMYDHANTFLTGSDNCPFCIVNDPLHNENACNECGYGKTHGKCGEHGSDYQELISIKRKLLDAIEKYW